MEGYLRNKKTKILVFLLTAFMICAALGSSIAMLLLQQSYMLDFGPDGKIQFLDKAYKEVAGNYAAGLLDEMLNRTEDDKKANNIRWDMLEDSPMDYLVLTTDNPNSLLSKEPDLSKLENVVYKTNDFTSPTGIMVGRKGWDFTYDTRSIFGMLSSDTRAYDGNNSYYFYGWNEDNFPKLSKEDMERSPYFVVLYTVSTKTPPSDANPLFVKAKQVVDLFYLLPRILLFLLPLSMLLSLAGMVYLTLCAGRRPEDDQIHLYPWDRLYIEIQTLGFFLIAYLCFSITYIIARKMIPSAYIAITFFTAMVGYSLVCLGLLYYMSLVRKIKAHVFWRYSSFHIFHKLWLVIRQTIRLNASVIARIMAAFLILSFVEFLWMAGHEYNGSTIAFILVKIGESFLLFFIAGQYLLLSHSIQDIRDGHIYADIPLNKMHWIIKEDGERLKTVKEGVQTAVARQMKSERMKTELITNVTHDIKTPLTSIINYSDLIGREETSNPKIREYQEVLSRQSLRLKKLIEDLIQASKAASGNLDIKMETCNLAIILVQIQGDYEDRFRQKKLTLISNSKVDLPLIRADGQYLWRVLDNLFRNIEKYAMPATRVYLDISPTDDSIVLELKNISEIPLDIPGEELLQRFIRGDASRHKEGNGLGLSIAESIMTLMQGQMTVEVDGDLFKVQLLFTRAEKTGDY